MGARISYLMVSLRGLDEIFLKNKSHRRLTFYSLKAPLVLLHFCLANPILLGNQA
jgi:hypothetical protein